MTSFRRSRHGFTLTEILIVIGLILLVIALAVPALSVISGGRSVDAAQNQISAVLARARQDAMGLQEPRGIVFFPDANTGRTVAAEVWFPELAFNNPRLDLLPDRDEMELSAGVGCQIVPRGNGSGVGPFPAVGVILFDGLGRVMIRPYVIENPPGPNPDAPGRRLWNRLQPLPGLPTPPTPPLGRYDPNSPTSTVLLTSQVGLLLYDQPAYDDAQDDPARIVFLRDNATPVLINRYNGTLLPAR
jgi:prepilin-type N-terminal cleavage/methylation domain-containing protein